MTPFYNIPQNTQAQNINAIAGFDYNQVEDGTKELNYFEKNRLIKFSALRKFKGQGQCILAVFDYFLDHANNKTGISYHSQMRMEACLGFSKRQIIRAIKLLEEAGYIYKARRGRNITNAYMINFELINDPTAMHGITPSILTSYPRNPRKTWSRPEVTSDVTLTTNTEESLKEVSINTYIDNTNFLNKIISQEVLPVEPVEEVFETTEPIPLTTDLLFRALTLNSIAKKTALTPARYYGALERWEAAYRYKYRDPSIRRTIEHWNKDFYRYCEYQNNCEMAKGTRMISHLKRMQYNERKPEIEAIIKANNEFVLTNEWIEQDNIWRAKMNKPLRPLLRLNC